MAPNIVAIESVSDPSALIMIRSSLRGSEVFASEAAKAATIAVFVPDPRDDGSNAPTASKIRGYASAKLYPS
jgi:hypothetical protein